MSTPAPRPFRFTIQASRLQHPDELRPLARKAEDLGVSTLTMADHLDDQVAPIAGLMAVADATTTLRVGSLVFCNDYRHPVVLAKEAATIDVLSGGRLDFGIGAGWMTDDYAASGIAMDRPGVRIARLEEALEIITSMWTDDVTNFDGTHYTVTGLVGLPRPVQSPRPPIVIGGGGPKVLALAGRHADIVGLNPTLTAGVIDAAAGPSATAAATEEKIAIVRAAAGDRFEQIELQTRVHLAIVTDDRDAMFELFADGFGLTADEARHSPHALCGTVDQIVEDLEARRERFGISAIGLSASSLDDMAPVIARLAGT
ncbi:MAG: TIGR03621 family F420-dependent LLM class oxidoreductase [Actinomycetota bacterium]|nr:TIGR03621 family F420-dependent LLM class oxidoreductase [Actinomycetota bacterium]